MQIKGFQTIESVSDNGIRCITIRDAGDLSPGGFDVSATFESGQCFRWTRIGEGRYSGIAYGRSVVVSCIDRKHILIENAVPQDFEEIWYDYLDLGTDYNAIASNTAKDDFMRRAIGFAGGARVLSQEFNETLFSYILSSQNNIPRIRGLVRELCRRHGNPVNAPAGDTGGVFSGFSFPSAVVLARDFCVRSESTAVSGECRACQAGNLCDERFAGYRCPYIARTASMLAGKLFVPDFAKLASEDQDLARKELCILPGVGEKVADCVLLYSGIRHDICPIDTWVEKTIKKIYLDEKASKKDIRNFTSDYFGEYAGYAQLWFFYYARSGAAD